jgi:hypothetical protein
MRVRQFSHSIGAVVVATWLVAAVVGAQQDAKMTPEQQKVMETWMKYATPGPNHKLLEPVVGSWNVATTWWEAPGAPPSTWKGSSENVWVLGGRFVQQTITAEMMGQPFSGIGYTGYDNFKEKFIFAWMDSMGTMVMISTGSADATGKVMTFTAEIDDVLTGKKAAVREVVRVIDNNKHVFEMYGPDKSGKEFKTMEIVYTRK